MIDVATTPPAPDSERMQRARQAVADKLQELTGELRSLQSNISAMLAQVDRRREQERELKETIASWELLGTAVEEHGGARPCSLCIEACAFCMPALKRT